MAPCDPPCPSCVFLAQLPAVPPEAGRERNPARTWRRAWLELWMPEDAAIVLEAAKPRARHPERMRILGDIDDFVGPKDSEGQEVYASAVGRVLECDNADMAVVEKTMESFDTPRNRKLRTYAGDSEAWLVPERRRARLDNPAGAAHPAAHPAALPEDVWRYFKHEPGTQLVEVDQLETTRARAGGIERAEANMRRAYDGEGEKRGPIHVSVVPGTTGDLERYQVEDGNSTTAIARKHGWRFLPALVVEPGSHS